MTGTIFDFFTIWGDYDFRRLRIQEADIVAFALLSYATFENTDFYKQVKNENKFFEIKKFAQEGFEKLNKTNLIPNGYSKFLHRFFSIKRYKRIKIGYFDDEVNKDKKIQFFAFTISFSNFNIVCFRGTDTSIVGWEEDLNMAADEYVPSQIAALNYVNKILENDEKDLIILGHSKGGNLAYYSFFKTSEENKKRIKKVYNFDGPGFRNDTFDYQKYSKNLAKVVPNDDIVGILFDTSDNYKIAKSNSVNVFAHDLSSWILDEENDFKTIKYVKKLTPSSEALKISFNSWINTLNNDEIKEITILIFKIFYSNNQRNIMNLRVDLIKSAKVYFSTLTNEDKKVRNDFSRKILEFIKLYFSNLFDLKKTHIFLRRK